LITQAMGKMDEPVLLLPQADQLEGSLEPKYRLELSYPPR